MQVIAEVAVGRPTLGNAAWVGITAVIVVAAYAVAIAVPNIWPVMVSALPRPFCTNRECCSGALSFCQSLCSNRHGCTVQRVKHVFLAVSCRSNA